LRGRTTEGQLISCHAEPDKGMESLYGSPWLPSTHPAAALAEGQSYSAEVDGTACELQVTTPWHIVDDTQFTHWAGAGMTQLYTDPMCVFAASLKAKRPDTVFIAGWGNRASEDHWAAWDLLYRPTIDAAPALIDGICDHDYGGDPRQMDGVYETICGYAMTTHGRWLYGYNTECANASDPQSIPAAAELGTAGADWRKATWCARIILCAAARVPDKARSQLHFGYGGPWFSDSGEGLALEALRSLRGRLLHLDHTDPGLVAVATVDGTDPRCPRAEGGYELCLAVAEVEGRSRNASIALQAPTGTRFAGPAQLTQLQAHHAAPQLAHSEVSIDVDAIDVTLCAHGFAVIRLTLSGEPDFSKSIVRRQNFADDVLQTLDAEHDWRRCIALPAHPNPQRAWLRLVVEHLTAEHYQVRINNGTAIPLPGCTTALNACDILDLPFPLAALSSKATIHIEAVRPDATPSLICSASLWLEGLED
jgi:hypothetical protein